MGLSSISCCGRSGRLAKSSVINDDELEKGMHRVEPGVEPFRHAIEGARTYARGMGLPDPHRTGFGHIRTTAPLLKALAHQYDHAPVTSDDPAVHRAHEAMAEETHRQFHHLTRNMGIKYQVQDEDPYRNIHELHHDVTRNGRIKVLSTAATGSHPVTPDEDNDRFRAVHDVFGHLASGRAFDRHGEEGAYQAHSRMYTPAALPAVASSLRGQTASLVMNRAFNVQKAHIMPERLWHPDAALWHPARHVGKLDIHDYRWEQDAQNRRAENATGGYRRETDSYFGRDGEGDGVEKRLNLKDYLKRDETSKERESFGNEEAAYRLGHSWGARHSTHPNPGSENEALDWDAFKHGKPDHFWKGYTHGAQGISDHMSVYAVLVDGLDDMPKGLVVTAHVSGNSIDVLHCPFCGSGAVIARSDATIECGYCMSIFTIQVQPAYSGFPQSVDGQPYQWPGQPDPNAVMSPDSPAGTNVNPMAQGEALGDGGLLGVPGGAPESSDPMAGGDEGDDDDDPDDSGNPFAKGKSDSGDSSDKKSDKDSGKSKSKSDNPFAKKKSSFDGELAPKCEVDNCKYSAVPGGKRCPKHGGKKKSVKDQTTCQDCGSKLYRNEENEWVSRHDRWGRENENGEFESTHHSAAGLESERHNPKTSSLVTGGLYKTANGAQLTSDEFEAHLAMRYARNPLIVAQRVRQARDNGSL